MTEKRPESGGGWPIWWHHHGIKMRLRPEGSSANSVLIQGSAAEVCITRAGTILGHKLDGWIVDWKVLQSQTEGSSGRTIMSDDSLAQAFGVRDGELQSTGDKWLINRYGGTVAKQGQFIRYRDYLNIPCPGTGHDGDPNVSIELDNNIRVAVRALIGISAE